MVNAPDLTSLTHQPVRWLWPGWLALGSLHILAGAPGIGKGTVAASLIARLAAAIFCLIKKLGLDAA